MTPAEKKARDAVVRAAKRLRSKRYLSTAWYPALDALWESVTRLQREEAKTKGKKCPTKK